MDSNRLKKAKYAVARLDWPDFQKLEKYFGIRRETLIKKKTNGWNQGRNSHKED